MNPYGYYQFPQFPYDYSSYATPEQMNPYVPTESYDPDRQPQLERRVSQLERENNRQQREIEQLERRVTRLERRLQRVNQRLRAVERRFNFPFTPFDGEY
ncbi:hypothetical protein [Neobacillus sp.]|jgi:predicted RNase H-like nuclease (RuvC/YqgF family)|uniref:hypothetical protein n=1 Tax=Neobacillus sp. TaxID=2675273 RepID=UPI0004F6FCA4|nr:hypothetical protein HW35_13330 [Bacillus sp. X1(2014)]